MRYFYVLLALMWCSFATAWPSPSSSATTVYSNIDDRTSGWGSCTGAACAGGTSAGSYWMAQNQNPPSLDGSSTEFYVDGSTWTNVLFWNKLGANDSIANFQTDFWVQLDQNSTVIGQAFEFDTFQFIKGREYMFGTQCDYATGVWEVWNAGAGAWQKTLVTCPKFAPNVWYHITWNFHRSQAWKNRNMYYDSFTVVQYDASNNVVANHSYALNLAYPSAPLPSGWSDNLGVQFQIDLNGQSGVSSNPSSVTEYVDKVKLSAW